MMLYYIKVNLALGLLYLFYRLLFRKDTFFRLRRLTLLGIILLAFLYPLPDIKEWISQQPLLVEYVQVYSSVYRSNEIAFSSGNIPETGLGSASETGMNDGIVAKIASGIYLSGIFILIFRCTAGLFSIYRTCRKSRKQVIDGITVYVSPETEEPYSFFRLIFIRPGKYSRRTLSEILIHERTHVRQLHSLDVALGEVLTVLCWINPFAWLLKKEININHEYIADQEVLNTGFNKKEYQYHLLGLEHSPAMVATNLYSYFSVLPLKKRIIMLNKKRMHRAGSIKYLALVPLAAALLIVNNMDVMARIGFEQEAIPFDVPVIVPPDAPVPPDDEKVFTVVDVMPVFPGGEYALLKYISDNVKYPESAQKEGKQGRVVVGFIVEKDGSVSGAEVRRGVDPVLDKEAVQVVNTLPKWTPGKKDGKVVRTEYLLPVMFRMIRSHTPQPGK